MPNNNNLIPKENVPKIEEVRYLDHNYQPMSYEEFMKAYEPNEQVELITEVEYQDRLANGSQYGPGNEASKEVCKVVSKTAISVGAAGAILATGGAAAPVVLGGIAAGAGGKLVKEAAKECDNEFFEWVGDTVCDTGINMLTGSLAGSTSSVPNNLASHIAKETAKGGHIVAGVMRKLKQGYDCYGEIKDTFEGAAGFYHGQHKDCGISHKRDCPICN